MIVDGGVVSGSAAAAAATGAHCSLLHVSKLVPAVSTLKRMKWMNNKALPREAYCPTPVEHIANIVTHGLLIVPSLWAVCELLKRSHSGSQMISSLVYGATLVFLFSISTSFHCIFFTRTHGHWKNVLHRCDRAMIYVFIAGSYYPWLTLQPLPQNSWSSSLKWFIWLMAVIGIIYQQTFHEKYKRLETCFYMLIGTGPALAIFNEYDFNGTTELKMGGIIYMLGVVFFKSDGVIPCAHAIWHLFVAIAAAVHYYAVLCYLYPLTSVTQP